MAGTVQSMSELAYNREGQNVNAFKKYLQVYYPESAYLRFVDKVAIGEKSGDQILLKRSVKINAITSVVINGQGTGFTTSSENSFRNKLLQYAKAIQIDNMTMITYGGGDWSRYMMDIKQSLMQAMSEGADMNIYIAMLNSLPLSYDTNVGADGLPSILDTDALSTISQTLLNNYAFRCKEMMDGTPNWGTSGTNESYVAIIGSDQAKVIKSLANFITPIRYGAGSKDMMNFSEMGTAQTNAVMDIRFYWSNLAYPNAVTTLSSSTATKQVASMVVLSKECFAIVSLPSTSFKDSIPGKPSVDLNSVVQRAIAIDCKISENDISNNLYYGNESFQIGMLLSIVSRYTPMNTTQAQAMNVQYGVA